MHPSLSIAILCAATGLAALLGQSTARHNFVPDYEVCFVEQLLGLPENIDVLLVGSSRIRYAVDPFVLDEALGNTAGTSFNIGRNGDTPERTYALIKDILQSGISVETVVIDFRLHDFYYNEPVEQWRRIGMGAMRHSDLPHYHAAFPQQRGIAGQVLLQATETKLAHGIRMLLNGQILSSMSISDPAVKPDCLHQNRPISAKTQARDAARIEKFVQRFSVSDVRVQDKWAYLEQGYDSPQLFPRAQLALYFLEETRRLTEEYGAELKVISPPMYKEIPMSAAAKRDLRTWIPELILPTDDAIIAAQTGYFDTRHMGEPLRKLYTQWLVSELR